MGRPKKKIQKRQKIFNFISWAIDLIKFRWKETVSIAGAGAFIYVVFFWLDTVDTIIFEIIYY